jgi:hypothetical protein
MHVNITKNIGKTETLLCFHGPNTEPTTDIKQEKILKSDRQNLFHIEWQSDV